MECAHVLVQVTLVEPLYLLDGIIARIQLLSELFKFDFARLNKLVAALTFTVKLDDAPAEPIEIFKHD